MNALFSRRSTSDWIVFLVSQNQGIRCRHVWKKMREKGVEVSYQNVHKLLCGMVKNRVLEKREKKYFVSQKWVLELKEFADSVKV